MSKWKMTKADVDEYVMACGAEAAWNLLLLCGPDGYDGTWEEYMDLCNKLKGEKNGKI